jgi:hypothetical protein
MDCLLKFRRWHARFGVGSRVIGDHQENAGRQPLFLASSRHAFASASKCRKWLPE